MTYIVAMTSWKKRIHCVDMTIFMMLKQTIPPSQIVLTLSLEEFPHGLCDLPKDLQLLAYRNPILSIQWEHGNSKAFKKVIPVIKAHKNENCYILAVDDDVCYSEYYAEYMLNLANTHEFHYLTPGTWGIHPHGYAMIYNPIWFRDDLLWSLTSKDMEIICASDAWIWAVLKHNNIEPFVAPDINKLIVDLDMPDKLSKQYANIAHTNMRHVYIENLIKRYTK